MVYVPWRLSSLDACHISEEEWTGLRIIVIEALNQSSIGLEGPSVHGQAWDDWYEALAENVAKKYWPDTDRSALAAPHSLLSPLNPIPISGKRTNLQNPASVGSSGLR